ncbi:MULTISPECIES: hypothetical protein [Niastella]|uniref:Glycine zipper domain-containing protein n=1 Tax=Niastella soli TaxID=2821487 RepID=A0ABS3Z5L1_9BACT|nr:hypothetical protein [Niastella soli]MBO9205455.1 hypothetical protein [Niastella soli]
MLEDFRARGIYLTEDEYRTGLRSLFSEDYQHLTDDMLEDIIYDRIAAMSPSEAEGFFNSIGNFIKDKVAPVAVAALPAATTAVGTIFGGPIGAAAGGAVGKFAADNISKYGKIKPNPYVASAGGIATALASGNYKAAIPNVINLGQQIGNRISPGAGNKIAGVASNVYQAGTALASGNYAGAINAGRNVGNAISPGLGNRFGNIASTAGGIAAGMLNGQGNNAPAQAQLMNFIKSTPFLQSMLSSIATGNLGTGLQMLKEDGSTTTTSYVEMLESLKYLTENAIAEADNAGAYGNLSFESESDRDGYIEALIEDIGNYENALLPNYDTVTY